MKNLFKIFFILMLIGGTAHAFNGSSFDKPVGACVNHILVPTIEQANQLKDEIKTFEDFQRLASIYSECPSGKAGGSLGCFGYGQMVRPFEKAAFNEPIGEVVGPVKTQFGYHLLWITRRY